MRKRHHFSFETDTDDILGVLPERCKNRTNQRPCSPYVIFSALNSTTTVMAAPCEQHESGRLDKAIEVVVDRIPDISALKPQQTKALKAFINGEDVFALLPTGFGKSLIYQLAPLVLEELGVEKPLVIVISPLVALMEEQVKEAAEKGVKALRLGVDEDSDVVNGRCSLIFGSPEAWLTGQMEEHVGFPSLQRQTVWCCCR